MPFPNFTDHNVSVVVLRGKRPEKPRRFDAPGITPAVWKVAKKCWHEKASGRPEVKKVLEDLQKIANSGKRTNKGCFSRGS